MTLIGGVYGLEIGLGALARKVDPVASLALEIDSLGSILSHAPSFAGFITKQTHAAGSQSLESI